MIAAFFYSPWAALAVAIAYLVIQQLEGHVLAPNIVGNSVGVHPLLVIFALLAGAQIGGILGMIASLPILAMLKHTFTFYEFKFSRAPWVGDDGAVVVRALPEGPLPPGERKPDEVPDGDAVARWLATKTRAAGKAVAVGSAKVLSKFRAQRSADKHDEAQ